MNISDLKSLDDVQKFIDLHFDLFPNVLSLKNKNYRRVEEVDGIKTKDLWILIYRNKYGPLIKWSKTRSDLSIFNSIEDFQRIIDNNSLRSAREFSHKFSGIYSKAQKLGLLSHLTYNNKPSRKLFLKSFSTYQDYSEFIENHGFGKPSEFKEHDERLYRKFIEDGFSRVYRWKYNYDNWKFPEDAQYLIDCNGWECPSDMYTDPYGRHIYSAVNSRGLVNKLVFSKRQARYTQEEALKLIELECEKCNYIFTNKNSFEYKGSLESNIELFCPFHNYQWKTSFNSFVNSGHGCKICGITRSLLEEEVENLLKSNNIEYESEKTFDWLVNIRKLPIDFYIPKLNLAVECQGEQHFHCVGWFTEESFNDQIKRDQIKFDLCRSHGINILYYCNPEVLKKGRSHRVSEIISSFGSYISTVYTSTDELLRRILKQ